MAKQSPIPNQGEVTKREFAHRYLVNNAPASGLYERTKFYKFMETPRDNLKVSSVDAYYRRLGDIEEHIHIYNISSGKGNLTLKYREEWPSERVSIEAWGESAAVDGIEKIIKDEQKSRLAAVPAASLP